MPEYLEYVVSVRKFDHEDEESMKMKVQYALDGTLYEFAPRVYNKNEV